MIKVVAAAFIVAIASSAQAMPRAAVEQPDSLVTTVCAKRAEQVCIVLMVSACVLPLGVKRPGALQDYVTSVAAVSDKRPQADITGLFVGL